jgi:molybdate transport system permease protein
MAFPLFVRSARTAFEEVDPRLLGVARTLGDGPLRVFRRVALPLAWRGILAGALLSFCRAMGEFGATILIAGNIPGRTQTLALAIFQRSQSGRDFEAMRLVALTAFIALAVVSAGELVSRRRSKPFAR